MTMLVMLVMLMMLMTMAMVGQSLRHLSRDHNAQQTQPDPVAWNLILGSAPWNLNPCWLVVVVSAVVVVSSIVVVFSVQLSRLVPGVWLQDSGVWLQDSCGCLPLYMTQDRRCLPVYI